MKRFTIIEPLLQIRHLLYFHGLKFSSFFLKFLPITVQLLYISLCFFFVWGFLPTECCCSLRSDFGPYIVDKICIISKFRVDRKFPMYIRTCCLKWLILTQNMADVLHVQGLLLKCPNLVPWDSQ